MPTAKNRTPSKCREWERERRNKFNNACNQLAVLVVENTDTNESANRRNAQNTSPHLAKIEVVLQAISCIKKLLEIKVKLEEKITALEASINVFNTSKKDASVQVQIVAKVTKSKSSALKKIVRKEKCTPLKTENTGKSLKFSKLMPKITEKKAPDKTVIMLPATPYVIPQRPVILPTPTLLLVENFSPSSRSTLPILPRVVSEITKTTMVNNIPISAFSFPLSCANNICDRIGNRRLGKIHKKKVKLLKTNKKLSKTVTPGKNISIENHDVGTHGKDKSNEKSKSPAYCAEEKTTKENITLTVAVTNQTSNEDELKDNPQEETSKENVEKEKSSKLSTENATNKVCEVNKINGAIHEMQEVPKHDETNTISQSNKDSRDKFGSMIDTTLCDNTVDGGNARLELAEELLAASPTAAFLMSFPLVSGVRADSPAEDDHSAANGRPISQSKRESSAADTHNIESFFAKPDNVEKIQRNVNINSETSRDFHNKLKLADKQNISKDIIQNEIFVSPMKSQALNETAFLHLPSSLLNTTVNSSEHGMVPFEFDPSYSKVASVTQTLGNNLVTKYDSVTSKSNSLGIYTNNTLSVPHDYNSFGLFPCAMDKYSYNNRGKSDNYTADDSGHKIGPGRLSYDFDLNMAQKQFEFTNVTNNSNNISKENVFPSVATTFSSTSYNPFNPDFHVPLASSTSHSTSGKKDNVKTNPFYADTFTNLYSQPSTFWPEDLNQYANNSTNTSKSNMKPQCHTSFNDHHSNKNTSVNIFENKVQNYNTYLAKPSKLEVNQLVSDKNNKKSASKSHINWMTSEARPTYGNSFDMHHTEYKESNRIQLDSAINTTMIPHFEYNLVNKKQDCAESNLFCVGMPTHHNQEDIQLWPPTKPLMSAEVSLDPPPINLPTLVGDLALGPHERRKSVERPHRGNPTHPEMSSCNNFFSVTQLMNRSTETSAAGRGQTATGDVLKHSSVKSQQVFTYPSLSVHDKRPFQADINSMQSCYFTGEPKQTNMFYENSQIKQKSQKASERVKYQKNNYSTEALLKGASSGNKANNNFSLKFSNPTTQKYPSYVPGQDVQVTQMSHLPCISDYPENTYSGSGFYNSSCTTSNSFYSNLIPTNYTLANFTPEYVDYSAAADVNLAYPIFDNGAMGNQLDVPIKSLDSKAMPKESATKHKVEFSKKEQTKKHSNKKAKMSESKDWNEGEVYLAAKVPKNRSYVMSEDYVANYLVNQSLPTAPHAILPELVTYPAPTPTPIVTPSTSRTLLNCPTNATRTNFNLSTLFPEIAKVRQS